MGTGLEGSLERDLTDERLCADRKPRADGPQTPSGCPPLRAMRRTLNLIQDVPLAQGSEY